MKTLDVLKEVSEFEVLIKQYRSIIQTSQNK